MCLKQHEISKQDKHVEEIQESMGLYQVPTTILKVALQPTARGGSTHFTAGNLRIVKFARALLEDSIRDEIVGGHNWFAAHIQEVGDEDDVSEEDWMSFMEDEHNIKENKGTGDGFEQLLVLSQTILACPLCQAGI